VSRVSIVIPVFRGWDLTQRCLTALTAAGGPPMTVIVVNHGPPDPNAALIARDFPEVVEIRASNDLWWAGATNVGIQHALSAEADFIILLNNDCVLPSTAAAALLNHAQSNPGAIVAPIQRDLHSTRITSVRPRDNLLLGFPTLPGADRLTSSMRGRPLLQTRLINGGRGVIIPRAVIDTVGLLDDEHLPHYGADHDWYFRARSARIPMFIATEASVFVDSDQTTEAATPGQLTLSQFLRSFTDPRSHRRFAYIHAIFRKHYPIPPLYYVGIGLYYIRYLAVYLRQRLQATLGQFAKQP
jgi:GT2 family glycosyltransferase